MDSETDSGDDMLNNKVRDKWRMTTKESGVIGLQMRLLRSTSHTQRATDLVSLIDEHELYAATTEWLVVGILTIVICMQLLQNRHNGRHPRH